MTNQKFASGAFVFTRARGLQPQDPDDLPPVAAHHGIDPTFIPTYAGDRVAISRAISQASSGLQREGFLLRPITRTSSHVVYGIVKEDRNETEQKLGHDFEGLVSWSAEPDPSVVHGEHPIARRVADAYREQRGKILADDFSAVITSYLEKHDAARVRGDGRVYWVPPQRLADVKKLGDFLAEVGIDLVCCEIEAESRTVVESVAQESLDEQINQLEQEAAAFDGTQKPSTYSRRIEEYQRLRERAVLYRDALGVGVERAAEILTKLEQKVSTMLDLRKQTVVHRDRSVDRVLLQSDSTGLARSATSVPTLRFAGATFTSAPSDDPTVVLFVSDDQAAIATAHVLEGMGLAGRWQQAGQAHVKIKNSGPPGANVTIAVKLPAAQPLRKYAPSLASLGIDVV